MSSVSDRYQVVLTALEQLGGLEVPVPRLAELLNVNASTLNARFRRRRAQVHTVGRTNFVPFDLARDLVRLHRAALAGWPTLQEASKLTGVKALTLKARCEKGKLTCSLDLTKRLRVDPGDCAGLSPQRLRVPAPRGATKPDFSGTEPRSRRNGLSSPATVAPQSRDRRWMPVVSAPVASPRRSLSALVVPSPEIRVLRPRDYGLAEDGFSTGRPAPSPVSNGKQVSRADSLTYDPERPLPVSQCRVGKLIRYEDYEGTILKIHPDPFSPRIQVRFPDHPHPLMREVMLLVGRDLARQEAR